MDREEVKSAAFEVGASVGTVDVEGDFCGNSELGKIGLLIGNLAVDGYSARDLLSQALLNTSLIDTLINALMTSSAPLTSHQTTNRFDALECLLWALETLLSDEMPKKSLKSLAKQVYEVVKQLGLVLSLLR